MSDNSAESQFGAMVQSNRAIRSQVKFGVYEHIYAYREKQP